MGKILVIAEKPSVGRDIAKVLGCNQKATGYLVGTQYIVSWAYGHLVTLSEPQDYNVKYKRWDFSTLPIIPEKMMLKEIKKTSQQLKVLKKLMNDKKIDGIICATDSGREGELIFRYIYDVADCKKAVQRLWISSMTDTAIKEGFAHLKDSSEYDLLYLSAKCRAEADWLVGMNTTRAYTLQYGVLLSIGRVQTPTLAMIVQRQKEINSFQSEEYYEVKADFGMFSGLWFSKKDGNYQHRITNEQDAKKIQEKVRGKQGVIQSIEKQEKRQNHPLLYDLTQLQRECNQKFGFSAQKTLDIAQKLYERYKLITYPRTDSRYLSSDMKDKVKAILKKLNQNEEYHQYCRGIPISTISFTKRVMDDSKVSDHHAIIPTDGSMRTNQLNQDEKKVYHFIVLRFLAVFYPAYLYEITKIISEIEDERFLSKGNTTIQEGWMELYRDFRQEKDEEQQLPSLKKGMELMVQDINILKKKTKAPANYTESTLLSAMENAGRFVEDESIKEQLKESGLGTPATRASMIERLLAVGYIKRKGKALIPTEKGMKLIEVVPEELKSPQTTGKWEKGLSSIAKGRMSEERFMESIKRYVRFLVDNSEQKKGSVTFAKEEKQYNKIKKSKNQLGKCPICNGTIFENSKSFYCGKWKEGCKFGIWKNSVTLYGVQLSSSLVKKLLKDKKVTGLNIILPQTGEPCEADLKLCEDNSGRIEFYNVTRKRT